jgi:predicted RNA-binding protein YlqC (UPF0109 family)
MQQLVEFMVKSLVDHPDEVQVVVNESSHSVVYEVHVNEEDIGKVIGRGGRIAEAMRTIVRSVPTTDGRRHTVEIAS